MPSGRFCLLLCLLLSVSAEEECEAASLLQGRTLGKELDLPDASRAASKASEVLDSAAKETSSQGAASSQGAVNARGAGYGMGGMGRMGMMMGGGFSFSMLFIIILTGLSGSILSVGSALFWSLYSFIGSFVTAEVDIEAKSEAHKWLEFWMSQCSELEERSSRWRMALARELGPQHATTNRASRLCAAAEAAHQENDPCFLPRDGESTRITFDGWWLWIKTTSPNDSGNNQASSNQFPMGPAGAGNQDKVIRIIAPFRNKAKIISLLKAAAELYNDKLKTHTMIWTVAGSGGGRCRWRVLDARPSRPLDTVVLQGDVAGEICKDVQGFLKGEAWYCARGVPYRRGYLLHGPPGCGKTSFITALAGELHLVICIINLASRELSDDSLLELLSEAPRHAIILLEDVDAAFRKEASPKEPAEQAPAMAPTFGGVAARRQQEATGVTFSGVLNAIDGVAAQEGKVLFLTTNHVDRLDDALVRPGRVDVRVYLGLASKDIARRLFLRFYKDAVVPDLQDQTNDAVLDSLASDFAAKIPDRQVSPATIQGLLMDHREDPRTALRDVERLLAKLAHPTEEASRSSPDADAGAGNQAEKLKGIKAVPAMEDKQLLATPPPPTDRPCPVAARGA